MAALGYLVAPRLRARHRSAAGRVDLAMFGFVLANLLSACFARFQDAAWDVFLDVLAWGVIYFLISRILTNSWRLRVFVFLLLLLNLKLAQFAIRGYFAQRAVGMSAMEIYMRRGGGAGSTGFFGNAGDFGVAMGVVWGIACALLFGRTEKKLPRVFLIVCFTLFLLAILLCGSRGAVVGAAAIVLAAFARTPKKIGAFVVALLFLCGIWFVLPDDYKGRFRSAWDWENDPNTFSRIMFWKAGLQMFEDHPILGVGTGNFPQAYATSYANLSILGPPAPHSVYIQVLAESGLVGTVSLLALLVLLLRLNARTRRQALGSDPAVRRSFEYCLALGLDLALVGYLVSGAFLTVLYYPHLWILLGLSVAANTACTNKQPVDQPAELQSRKRNFALAAP
jgi:O-antigen ligase